MTVELKPGETVLQIPNFPSDLKKKVQSKVMMENPPANSLKGLTILLYKAYLKGDIKINGNGK